MSLRETFARGFVWKLAGLLALAAFGWFAGIGKAHAQAGDFSACYDMMNIGSENGPLCPTRQVAYEQGMAVCEAYLQRSGYTHGCAVNAQWANMYRFRDTIYNGWTTHRGWEVECPVGASWNETTKKCQAPCEEGALLGGNNWVSFDYCEYGSPTSVCKDSCQYMQAEGDTTCTVSTVDGVTWTKVAEFVGTGNSCSGDSAGLGDAPPSDSDGDGTSDGNDSAPANPGQGAGGGGTEPSGEDGGQPGEGSGNGNTSAGGGDCSTPPNSHGDQIGAQIAYQAWATRCAIEGAKDGNGNVKTTEGTGTGTSAGGGDGLGTCAASEVGTVMCAMKTAVESIKGFVDGLGSEAGTLDTSEGEGDEPGSVWEEEEEEIDLDESGLGWGGSCPQLPVITVGNYSGQVDGGKLCEVLSALGALILLLAYFQAAIIIGR